jgi:hypothetical protein
MVQGTSRIRHGASMLMTTAGAGGPAESSLSNAPCLKQVCNAKTKETQAAAWHSRFQSGSQVQDLLFEALLTRGACVSFLLEQLESLPQTVNMIVGLF